MEEERGGGEDKLVKGGKRSIMMYKQVQPKTVLASLHTEPCHK